MADLFNDIESSVDLIIADYKASVADGKVTFAEIFKLLTNSVGSFVKLVEDFSDYSGSQKKAAVLAAIEKLFDTVIAPMDIEAIPNIVEGILDNAVKQLVLTVADGLIDAIVNIFNKSGWNTDIDESDEQVTKSAITIF